MFSPRGWTQWLHFPHLTIWGVRVVTWNPCYVQLYHMAWSRDHCLSSILHRGALLAGWARNNLWYPYRKEGEEEKTAGPAVERHSHLQSPRVRVWGVSWWWSLCSASEGWWATPYLPPRLKCKKKHKVVVNMTVGCARVWDPSKHVFDCPIPWTESATGPTVNQTRESTII